MRAVRGSVLLLALVAAGQVRAQQREYLDALRAARDKQFDRALSMLREVIRGSPDFGRAYARMAAISREAGKLETVRRELEILAVSNPHAHYGVAMANLQTRDLDAAEHRLIACIEEVPEFLPPYGELASLAVQRRRESVASGLFNRMAAASLGGVGPQFGLGYLHMLKAEYPRALDLLGRAAGERPKAIEIADAQYFVYYLRNSYTEALEVANRMLRAADDSGDLEWKGRLVGRIGMIHLDRGDLKSAAAELEQAVAIAHDITGSRSEQIFRGNLGAVYARQARYADALSEYREALRLAHETRDRPNEGRHLGLIAAIYADTGEYTRAAQSFEQSIDIAREVGDPASEATQLARLSLLYDAFGEHARALQVVERSLAVVRGLKNPWLESRFLEIQGLVYRHLGRTRESLAAHLRGLAVARQVASKYGEAAALWRAGDAHAVLGERTAARDCYRQALALAEQIGARTLEALALGGDAGLDLRAGNTDAAVRGYQRALEVGGRIQSPEIQWQAHAGLARALEATRPGEALAHYRSALEHVERVRDRLTLTDEMAGFLEDKVAVYRDTVRLLMSLHAAEPSAGHDAEAFRASERAHARALLDLLASGKGAAAGGVAPELLSRRREIEGSIASLQSRLVAENGKAQPDRARLAKLDAELSAAAEQHSGVLRRIRERTAAEVGASAVLPVTLEQVRGLLDRDTVLIEYSLGERASFVFAVSSTRHVVARLPAATVIASRVHKLRRAIAAQPTRLSLSNYIVEARQLYRDLLGPAAAIASRHRRWIVVPDGVLHYLPFEALLEPVEMDGAPDPATLAYLVRKHAISYVHSASVLAELQRRRPSGAREKSLVAFADPVYPGEPAGPAPVARGVLQASAAHLPRLPQTRREAESIAALYSSKRLYLGDDASEQQAKEPGALDAGVVQFAVHGLVNEERPQFSGLALSMARRAAESGETLQEDGLLQVYEILGLRMNTDLVVLSACETGLGREREGEGLLGLIQAFLHAGADSVAVSLWKVDDRSTADLMIAFHRNLTSGKADRVEALRRARVSLIGSAAGYAHPHYWAPFVLVGLPR